MMKLSCLGLLVLCLLSAFAPGLGGEPMCNFVLEVMHLQDMSSSFADDLPVLEVKLPELINEISATYPGSKFGMATFVDKPLLPFGYAAEGSWFAGDWCYNVTSPLTSGSAAQDLVDGLLAGGLGGGADWPENQLGAIYDIAKSNTLAGWSTDTHNADGLPIVRVMIVSTDALYHKAGDAAGSPNFLPPHKETGGAECTGEDYPMISQVSEVLQARNIYPIFLCGNTTGEDVVAAYEELLVNLGPKVHGAAHPLDADSSDIVDQMTKALLSLENLVCTNGTVDLVFSQDTTWSYNNDMPHFHNHAETVMQEISTEYSYAEFGVTTFADKPLIPLGHGPSGDYCYRLHQSLTDDKNLITAATGAITTVSGVDWKESQLDGMISSVLDPAVGWRGFNSWNGFKLVKIVALATDAGYHQASDANSAGWPLAAHSGGMVKCTEEEYPTWQILGEVLMNANVHPIFVPTSDIAIIYVKLLEKLEATYGIVGEVAELKDFNDVGDAVLHATRRLMARLSN